ncbi:Low-density lipoprotein receptor-related protein 5 [Colletotrichum chlorophyti]|uniref:Low-density lipoprotein receptor-related protein 5 n=1 Tax=Colletotrichum chlorophyti TaxID=708187 RepID=A0A1Q8RV27_9PEZI|nr:Low-density lipoprotein receptor-related protein 5 [Colletotrichum chlorophyti]
MGSQIQKRLYILDTDLSHPGRDERHGRILSCLPDGGDAQTIIDNMTTLPDGIAIDRKRGHMYWTNMGSSFKSDSGSIERANLDGSERQIIVPPGAVGVFTPKQITIANQSQKLYWCDREGMKVMRANLDGSDIEVLISTGHTDEERQDQKNWCVGIAVDEREGVFYWTQKGPSKGNQGRILRAPIQAPQDGSQRKVDLIFDKLPEPVDLEMDEQNRILYWTDRGDPPTGNSLNRAAVDASGERQTLAIRLHEAIGLCLDKTTDVAYITDLAGGVYAVDLRTREKRVLFSELGDITGVALV